MTALLFKDSFWGSDFTCHAGYEAVIQRLRDGRQMCKDVEELLKMRALAEEKYGKELLTVACKAGGQTEVSTLRASFEQLRAQLENIGNFHIQLSDTLKEEVKKIEVFRERQKEQRKKFQSIMEKIHRKKLSLHKKAMESKKNYQLRCKDVSEVERAAQKTDLTTKNSDKNTAQGFREPTSCHVCQVFQQLEADRIAMLRCALWDHCNHLSVQCVKDDQSYEEVRKELEKCDIVTDLNCFIRMKSTGTKPPDPVLFESYNRTKRSTKDNQQTASADGDDLTRSSDHLAPKSVNASTDTLQLSESASRKDTGGSVGGYAPLCFGRSLTSVSADESGYIVLFEYMAQELDELSVSRGEHVQVLERGEDGWWMVEKEGMTGLVPGNYLGKM
ncbi:Proline-serine-threonine phosphatase-interacting protein 1 [Takifugu flavidus]|uniref:Proline-serine-threonine phosphatase-interacting protein 1 n=1 Tax=Takifugu flavidus TaxID=433684 RepID=A0A5C6NL16_9TELE|nr:Proline-serine-threonine phosphatase-interacting protein 1 [Takifugu flavidus]